jgi:archaellum component FlaC
MNNEIELIEDEYKHFNEYYDEVTQKAIDKGFKTQSQIFIGGLIAELERDKYECIDVEDIVRIIDECLDIVVVEE